MNKPVKSLEERIEAVNTKIDKRSAKIMTIISEEIDRRMVAKDRLLHDIEKIKAKAERSKTRSITRMETLEARANSLEERRQRVLAEIETVREAGVNEVMEASVKLDNTHTMISKIDNLINLNLGKVDRLRNVNLKDADFRDSLIEKQKKETDVNVESGN